MKRNNELVYLFISWYIIDIFHNFDEGFQFLLGSLIVHTLWTVN